MFVRMCRPRAGGERDCIPTNLRTRFPGFGLALTPLLLQVCLLLPPFSLALNQLQEWDQVLAILQKVSSYPECSPPGIPSPPHPPSCDFLLSGLCVFSLGVLGPCDCVLWEITCSMAGRNLEFTTFSYLHVSSHCFCMGKLLQTTYLSSSL